MLSTGAPARPRTPAKLIVRALNAAARRGHIQFGPFRFPCALGRSGVRVLKREGDGVTPRGRVRLRSVLYRPTGVRRFRTALELRVLHECDGWCDNACDRNYNRPVVLPYPESAERLWRTDGVYDVVVVLGYNDVPRIKNRGSAIFLHIARRGFQPTEGCIAMRRDDLLRLLKAVPRLTEIVIEI
jgi:L,D-peptidoglycan transpeptidase YkuD (ErfK/YbiS/YcfS/YnhG family)